MIKMTDHTLTSLKTLLGVLMVTIMAVKSASAEIIAPILSTEEIQITSNFAGTKLTLFGIIKRDRLTVSRAEDYDVIVRVLGPSENIIVRQKLRTFGLWLNRKSMSFPAAPSYLAILSNRSVDDITTKNLIADNNLKLSETSFATSHVGTRPGDLAFKNALLRNKTNDGLYFQNESAVVFLDENVFVATIDIPSHTPLGQYFLEIYGFNGQSLISEATASFRIIKTGFEYQVYAMAKDKAFFYGLICILIAYSVGWLGWFIFKRS